MYIRELYNIMAIPLVEGGIKETIDRQNNIITDESAQCTILPHQLKHMSAYNKVLCGCECWISSKGMHFYLLPWREHYLKKLKTRVITHTIEGLVVWKFVFLKPKECYEATWASYPQNVTSCGHGKNIPPPIW